MCNLYRMTTPADEVARMFGLAAAAPSNRADEIYPGMPGLVCEGGRLRTMAWGFPLALQGKSGKKRKPKPVNNARTDKLDSPFWKASFAARRCLIPLNAFAEAEGPKGGKTRTWFSLPDEPVFTAAGIWRDSAEWGAVYAMVMTDAAPAMAGIHHRSPVLIAPDQRAAWQRGSPEQALTLCMPYTGVMAIDRTDQPWVARS